MNLLSNRASKVSAANRSGWSRSKRLFLVVTAVLSIALNQGCAGSGSALAATSRVDQLTEEAILLSIDQDATFDPVSGILVLPEGVTAVTGSVIIDQDTLVIITSIDRSRGHDEFHAVQASITDAIWQTNTTVDKDYSSYEIEWSEIATGVTIEENGGDGRAYSPPTIRINMDYGGVHVEGTLDIEIGVDYNLDIRFAKLKAFRFIPRIVIKPNIQFSGEFSGSYEKRRRLVRAYLPIAGATPVEARLDIYFGVDASGTINFEVDVNGRAMGEAGIIYDGSNWSTVSNADVNIVAKPTKMIEGSANVGVTLIGVEAAILFSRFAGPYANFRVPRLSANLSSQPSPRGVNVRTQAEFTGDGGVRIEIFGFEVADINFGTFFNRTIPIGETFWSFPDTGGGGTTGGGTTGGTTSGGTTTGGGTGGGTTITIDNSDAGYKKYGSTWWQGDTWWEHHTDCGINGEYWMTWSKSSISSPVHYGIWRPNISSAQNYQVKVFIPFCEGRTNDARYEIWVGGSRVRTVVVDQLAYQNVWVSLGTYSFPTGTSSYVKLTDISAYSGGYRIVHDAVKWIPK